MKEISLGDVVRTSEKVNMTVESISRDSAVCIWFDDKNQLQRKTFKKEMLTIID